MGKKILTLFFFIFIATAIFSQVDFEIRGTGRDGKYPNEKLLKQWPEEGPELLVSITNIGAGFTMPAVTNDRIYITGMIDSIGFLFSFDLRGELLWKTAYGKEWTNNFPGSRSTPTIVGEMIYFEDSFGNVYCYNKSGEIVWTVDMEKEFGFRSIKWGANESLLIDGDLLYCTPGGVDVMIAVLNRHDGSTINTIKGNGQKSAHCSPVIINHNNKRLLLTMTAKALVGVDLETMRMVFQDEFFNEWEGNPNTPLYKDGKILITTEKTGSKLLEISNEGDSLLTVWCDSTYDCENEGAILLDGYVYMGTSSKKTWFCFEWETGKLIYSDKKLLGKANVVFADELLYTYNFKGFVSLVKPNLEKVEVISQFKMEQGSKHHVTHPVIKDGKLYVRHGDVLNIYNIAG